MVSMTVGMKIGAKKFINPLKAEKWKKNQHRPPNKERNLNKPEVGGNVKLQINDIGN